MLIKVGILANIPIYEESLKKNKKGSRGEMIFVVQN